MEGTDDNTNSPGLQGRRLLLKYLFYSYDGLNFMRYSFKSPPDMNSRIIIVYTLIRRMSNSVSVA